MKGKQMLNLFDIRPLEQPRENLKVIISIDFKNDYSIIDLLDLPDPTIDFLREEYYNMDSQEIFDWNDLFYPKRMRPGTFFEIEFFIRCEQVPYEDPNDMDCVATVNGVKQVVYDNLNNQWVQYGYELDKIFKGINESDIGTEHD
jgi:hypothetical protein